MKEFIQKNKIAVLIGCFCLVVVPAAIFVASFLLNGIAEKSVLLDENLIKGDVERGFLYSRSSVDDDANFIEENKQKLDVFLPDNDNATVDLFKKIESQAESAGIANISLNIVEYQAPLKVKGAEDLDVLTPAYDNFIALQLAGDGEFSSALSFMKRLENFSYMSDILRVSLQPGALVKNETANGSEIFQAPRVQVAIEMVIYKK